MDMDVQSYLIGHLGIVAGIFDALNIADVIDRVSSQERFAKSSSFSNYQSYDPERLGFYWSAAIPFSQLFHDDSYRKATW